jgi:CRISPR-associated protein Cas5d
MINGVIRFVRPEECDIRKVVHGMTPKPFGVGKNLLDVTIEAERAEV